MQHHTDLKLLFSRDVKHKKHLSCNYLVSVFFVGCLSLLYSLFLFPCFRLFLIVDMFGKKSNQTVFFKCSKVKLPKQAQMNVSQYETVVSSYLITLIKTPL